MDTAEKTGCCKKLLLKNMVVQKTVQTTGQLIGKKIKMAVHKTVEATEELIGNKIAEKIVKQKPIPDKNSRNVEEIVFHQRKDKEILNKLRQVL